MTTDSLPPLSGGFFVTLSNIKSLSSGQKSGSNRQTGCGRRKATTEKIGGKAPTTPHLPTQPQIPQPVEPVQIGALSAPGSTHSPGL